MIGNYGVIPEDFEGEKIHAFGYIVSEACGSPSNFRSGGNISELLRGQNIPGIYGIDTRYLTRLIRERGTLGGKISYKPLVGLDGDVLREIAEYRVTDAVKNVSVKDIILDLNKNYKYKIAMIDYGFKENIKRELEKRGCAVNIFPFDCDINKILDFNPDGIMLSSGPGDPADNPEIINNIKDIIKLSLPVFGIGLGHQLLALAHGFATKKLKYGHRGANQPVKNLMDGKVYTTNQNHGYTVEPESIDKNIAGILFENVNDKTCEGLEYKNKSVFSCEFFPEAFNKSERNTSFLFDKFIKSMEG